jgi:uncharacterized membrane protein
VSLLFLRRIDSRLDLFLLESRNPNIENSNTSPSASTNLAPAENSPLLILSGIIIATLLGHALWLNNGAIHPTGILLVAISIAISSLAIICSTKASLNISSQAIQLTLWVALGSQFAVINLIPPGVYISASGPDWQIFSAVLAATTFVAGGIISNNRLINSLSFYISLAAFVFLALWVIRFSPSPKIDVFGFQVEAIRSLLGGSNPYEIRTPNIYGHTHFYGPGVVHDGVVQFGFPYFPLSLLAVIPGGLLGDLRFAQIFFIVATGILFTRLQPGSIGRGIALLYWFSPRTLFVIEQSWTEPLMLFLATLVALAAKTNPRIVAPAFGLLLSAKQTMFLMPFLFPLLNLGDFKGQIRALCISLGIAGLITLPFFLWNPLEFWRSVIDWQLIQPSRPDALSFSALSHSVTGTYFPVYLPFLGSAACVALAFWKSARSPAGWAMSTTMVYLVFFAMNKQAFCNYYFMVIGFACLAAACASVPDSVNRSSAKNP